jgi:hypothetical protein
MDQQFLARVLFYADGVLKIARSAQLLFFIFRFSFFIFLPVPFSLFLPCAPGEAGAFQWVRNKLPDPLSFTRGINIARSIKSLLLKGTIKKTGKGKYKIVDPYFQEFLRRNKYYAHRMILLAVGENFLF